MGQQELQSELGPQVATNEENLPLKLPQKDKKMNLTGNGVVSTHWQCRWDIVDLRWGSCSFGPNGKYDPRIYANQDEQGSDQGRPIRGGNMGGLAQ